MESRKIVIAFPLSSSSTSFSSSSPSFSQSCVALRRGQTVYEFRGANCASRRKNLRPVLTSQLNYRRNDAIIAGTSPLSRMPESSHWFIATVKRHYFPVRCPLRNPKVKARARLSYDFIMQKSERIMQRDNQALGRDCLQQSREKVPLALSRTFQRTPFFLSQAARYLVLTRE